MSNTIADPYCSTVVSQQPKLTLYLFTLHLKLYLSSNISKSFFNHFPTPKMPKRAAKVETFSLPAKYFLTIQKNVVYLQLK